jgi:hypothetical protein
MSRDLFIYHPGTGTVIPLCDPVYLIENTPLVGEGEEGTVGDFFLAYEPDKFAAARHGIRIDNYNMTNLFFGA